MAGSDRTVTAKQLGFLLDDLSERRIQQLAGEGVIVKEARGRYNLTESIRGYVRYLRDGQVGVETGAESEWSNARTEKMRADADRAIMEAAQLAGQLIPVEIVEYQWQHMIGAVRAKMLNLPKKTAPLVQHEGTFAKCRTILNAAVHECLAELSAYKPPASHNRNLAAILDGTTARSDDQPVGGSQKKTKQRK